MQELLSWAQKVLNEKGYTVVGEPKLLRKVPWSTVWRFPTKLGKVYLKAMAKDFAYEAALISFLSRQGFDQLPLILETHPVHQCFLMQDAGDSLLSILESNYDIALVERVLKSYAKLQVQCIPFSEHLKTIGLNDLSPQALPTLFEALIKDTDLGFKPNDLAQLTKSQARLREKCLELNAIGIPTTLDHGDLDPDNILIKNKAITFLDFGDAIVSHPFFSLAEFLNHAQSHHGLKSSSPQYLAVRDAYLNEWESFAPHNKLVRGFTIAYSLLPYVWVFGLKRIRSCPELSEAEYASYVDKVMQYYYTTCA